MQLLMALYGYRRSPRLWQDHFVQCVEQCTVVKMRRAKSEPSAFLDVEKKTILIVHVDDLLIFWPLKVIQEFYEELQSKVLLKLVGLLKNSGDEVVYVGHTLRMCFGHGYSGELNRDGL